MNEQLQEAVASLMDKSIVAMEAGAGFLSEEIPEVINQLLLWHMVSSLFQSILAILILISIGFILKHQIKYWFEDIEVEKHSRTIKIKRFDEGYGLLALLNLFLLIPVIHAIVIVNFTWLQIWIAPKIFLIEYAAKLVK